MLPTNTLTDENEFFGSYSDFRLAHNPLTTDNSLDAADSPEV